MVRSATNRPRWRRDRGAAAVEMALVLPLLMLVICGIIDFGRMFNAQITLTQASREGARAAAFGQTSGQTTARVQLAASGLSDPVTVTGIVNCPNAGGVAKVTAATSFEFVTPFAMFAGMFGATPEGTYSLTSDAVVTCSS